MAAAQLSYSNDPGSLPAGSLATSDDYVAASLTNTTGALVPHGLGVVRGSTDTNFALPSSKSNKFAGIVLRDQFGNASNAAVPQGSPGVADKDVAAVIRQGKVVVAVEGAVAKGGQVFCRITTHGGLTPGNFRGDADVVSSADTAAIVAGAAFDTSTSGAGFAVVDLYGQLGALT